MRLGATRLVDHCVEVSCRDIFGSVHAGLEVGSRSGTAAIELRSRTRCRSEDNRAYGQRRQYAGSYLRAVACAPDVLHIDFGEDFGEHFHALEVVDGKELVVVLLRDFMSDNLAVDYGCHGILGLCRSFFLSFLFTFRLLLRDNGLNGDAFH